MKKWSVDEGNCSISYTLSVAGGRWKWLILYKLFKNKVMRYGELKRNLPSITHKMLSQVLSELRNDELIERIDYAQVPPKVEYRLNERGNSLIPILELMAQWGRENRLSEILENGSNDNLV
ncbi:winged helix-turn-helix transcriptional regulator [Sporolactobacillus laevolacticus]|uniref:Regulatory protein n=1 Tax=Sporolactobacillus laevolacticus DSM 442 TaxID=1395513 RepID=V6J900_9BACL|nr:helix-turn-helix domain-containing protein [Sporolactobacillus laevolacticus]EST13259.1 regulatory protein [Sporolactobacillus laevolacticus DSM 442]